MEEARNRALRSLREALREDIEGEIKIKEQEVAASIREEGAVEGKFVFLFAGAEEYRRPGFQWFVDVEKATCDVYVHPGR